MDSFCNETKEWKLRGLHTLTTALNTQALGLFLSIVFTLAVSSCGGNGSSTSQQSGAEVGGNWQFAMSTSNTSFIASPLQGGFLLQKNGNITGQIEFAIVLPSTNGGANTTCNSGVAPVTGTISGQTVNLTASIGALDGSGAATTQTLTLSGGTLSSSDTVLQNGTYTLSAGYALLQGTLTPCGGGSQDVGTWSATLVPPLSGGFQGFFHSTLGSGFVNQNIPVSGTFTQGPNIGAASATITGTLLFQDPVSLLNDYPCLATASVNGTISGNTVLLQIFSTGGTQVGQIGQTPGSGNPPTAVTFDSTQSGYVVHNLMGVTGGQSGGGYVVATKPCSSGDSGNLCLALGSSKACSQAILLTPFSLTFPGQLLGSTATSQTITLSNTSGSTLSGLRLRFGDNDSLEFYNSGGDFNGVPNFTEQDNCVQQGSISLAAGASCAITVSFSPQESCPWLPQGNAGILGLAPASCPVKLTASLTINVPSGSADADTQFSAPISGTGLSAVVPSVPEIDFGAQALGEASPPQSLTFTNQSPNPVTILPAMACPFSASIEPAIPRPPLAGGQPLVAGLQLAETANIGLTNSGPILNQSQVAPPLVNAPTVDYFCDLDPPRANGGSGVSNFEISQDGCSGQTLAPFGQSGNSCNLLITFVPQPVTWTAAINAATGLDDFLQLNTDWCGDSSNPPEPNCEVDSGRFPVEIKTNPPSPLRMLPSAGMDFGIVPKGTASPPMTITLFNDPVDPKAATVTFSSKLVTGADYRESDTCPAALLSNQSCAITVVFAPTITGLDPGKITFTYSTPTSLGLTQTIYLRGTGQ